MTQFFVATPVSGPLTADQGTAIINSFRSVHQFQTFDQFSVIYISEQLVLQLDRGAMESIVEYMVAKHPDDRRTAFLANLTRKMRVRPRPEPEVLAAKPAPEPDPEPEAVSHFGALSPKYVARVRFNLLNGRRLEETRAVNTLSELDYLLDHGPYDDTIKNIKIKLELQL